MSDDSDDESSSDELTPTERLFTDCEWMRRWVLAIMLASLQVMWATLMAAGAVLKIIEYGMHAYVRHYTNWSWTLQILFYYGSIATPFILAGLIHPNSRLGYATQVVLVVGFLPLNGVVWSVMGLVSVLLGTNSPFLTNVFTELAPSIVMLGNDLYHVWPVIGILIFYIVYNKFVHFSINGVYAHGAILGNAWLLMLFLLYEAFVGSLASMASYGLIFNPQEVYQTDVPIGVGVGVVLLILAGVSLVPLLVIVAIYNVGNRVAYPYEWLLLNEKDPETWIRMHAGSVKMV